VHQGLSAERGDDLVVDTADPDGRVREVDDRVSGRVQRGQRGADRDGLAGAGLTGDHPDPAFGDALPARPIARSCGWWSRGRGARRCQQSNRSRELISVSRCGCQRVGPGPACLASRLYVLVSDQVADLVGLASIRLRGGGWDAAAELVAQGDEFGDPALHAVEVAGQQLGDVAARRALRVSDAKHLGDLGECQVQALRGADEPQPADCGVVVVAVPGRGARAQVAARTARRSGLSGPGSRSGWPAVRSALKASQGLSFHPGAGFTVGDRRETPR